MANRRLPVRKLKEILRLKYACGLSKREIARSCNVARSTVADYLMRAMAAGLRWPESAELSETELEKRLFPTEPVPSSPLPILSGCRCRMRRPTATISGSSACSRMPGSAGRLAWRISTTGIPAA